MANTINETYIEKTNLKDIKKLIFNRIFPITNEEGFYMNQKIGNCYLIASLNAMRLNKYFIQDLYDNIEFVLGKNIYKSKVIYKFPDGEKVIVVLKDLKIQKEKVDGQELENIVELFNNKKEIPIENYLPNQAELNNSLESISIIEDILKYIENNKDRVSELLGKEKAEFYEDSRGRKKLLFKKDFVEEIEEQIKNKSGEYYEYLLKNKKYLSVDSPLGYKILEALYTKKVFNSNVRKNIISGLSIDVFNLFLDDKKWDKFSLIPNIYNKEQIINILYLFNSNPDNYIITASIRKRNPLNTTPYFYYNNIKMAEGHAYSVVGFEQDKWEIEIVNPWNNNKSLFFSIDEFFKLFSNITIAKRKDS